MQIDIDKLAMQDMISKINQLDMENKSQRIKLEALKNCYESLASAIHTIYMLTSKEHTNKDWKKCSSSLCESCHSVLIKLGFEL